MEDYHQQVIVTDLDRDLLFELLESTMPDLAWRRGESEAEGALTISGRNRLGGRITFWFDDDRRGQVTVSVSFRGAGPDGEGSTAWQPALVDRLQREVVPAIEAGRSAGLAPGVRVVADLWSLLPPSGEDTVSAERAGPDLHLRIEAVPDRGGAAEVVTVVFGRAAFHLEEAIPGPTALDGLFSNAGLDVGQVADLGPTGFLGQWLDDPANAAELPPSDAHHYFVMFWEAGVAHHVVAASVDVQRGE